MSALIILAMFLLDVDLFTDFHVESDLWKSCVVVHILLQELDMPDVWPGQGLVAPSLIMLTTGESCTSEHGNQPKWT